MLWCFCVDYHVVTLLTLVMFDGGRVVGVRADLDWTRVALVVVDQAPVVRDLLIVSIRMYNCTMYADMGPQILGSILLSIWEVLF